jgi:hypothetical protein
MNARLMNLPATDPESGARALGSADDLLQLLRLAHGAAQRLAREVHGPSYDHAERLAEEIRRLRRNADALSAEVELLARS